MYNVLKGVRINCSVDPDGVTVLTLLHEGFFSQGWDGGLSRNVKAVFLTVGHGGEETEGRSERQERHMQTHGGVGGETTNWAISSL